MADNSAFLSYRRGDGYPWARLIWDELQNRSINAFLDLESMRHAGRFDERILNQIAGRPYFLMVLNEGSLDRCRSATDWVRREIEHAIETERIIVPLFIAPFEPSHFPRDLPPHIAEALANSNGVTFYSQFLAAAIDQLAEFLQPVGLATGDLDADDAAFEEQALSEVRAAPAPALPPPVFDSPATVTDDRSQSDPAPPPPPAGNNAQTVDDPGAGAGAASGPRVGPTDMLPAAGDSATDTAGGRDDHRAVPRDAQPDPDGGRDSRRGRGLMVVGVVVILLAAAAVGGWYLLSDDGASTLSEDEWLESGDSIGDGDAELTMLASGRLDLTYGGDTLDWAFDGPLQPGAAAVFQGDGNFVVYPFKSDVKGLVRHDAIWSTSTQGRGGTELRIVDTGTTAVLEINRSDGSTVVAMEGRS